MLTNDNPKLEQWYSIGLKTGKHVIAIENTINGNIEAAYYKNYETGELTQLTPEEIENDLF